MSALLTLFLCGGDDSCSAEMQSKAVCLQDGSAAAIAQTSASQLNKLAQTCETEYLGFVDWDRISPTDIAGIDAEFIKEIIANQPVAVILPLCFDDDERIPPAWPWENYPPRVASLLTPVDGSLMLLMRRDTILNALPLRDVSSPLQDWLIRVAVEDQAITISSNVLIAHSGGSPIDRPLLSPAHPGREQNWLLEHLRALTAEDLKLQIPSATNATAVQAGLFLFHDYLDESHSLSQSIEGQGNDGDYWHAIMHRREPDYSNGKYWAGRVGAHPVYSQLYEAISAKQEQLQRRYTDEPSQQFLQQLTSQRAWNANEFVDFCEDCNRDKHTPAYKLACEIQYLEMVLLLEHCYC